MAGSRIFKLHRLLHQHLFQSLSSILKLIQLRCALVRFSGGSERRLLLFLKLGSRLVNTFLLSVFNLMGFTKIALAEYNLVSQSHTFFSWALDVCLQLRHFDITLVDHASGFNDGSINCVPFMCKVFIATLEAFNVLFKDLNLAALLLDFIFVIKSHWSEAVFKQIATLLNISNFNPQSFKISVKSWIVWNFFSVSCDDWIVDWRRSMNCWAWCSRFNSRFRPRNISMACRQVNIFLANVNCFRFKLFWKPGSRIVIVRVHWREGRSLGLMLLNPKGFLSWVSTLVLAVLAWVSPLFLHFLSLVTSFMISGKLSHTFWRKPLGRTTVSGIFIRCLPSVFKWLAHLFDSFLILIKLTLSLVKRWRLLLWIGWMCLLLWLEGLLVRLSNWLSSCEFWTILPLFNCLAQRSGRNSAMVIWFVLHLEAMFNLNYGVSLLSKRTARVFVFAIGVCWHLR